MQLGCLLLLVFVANHTNLAEELTFELPDYADQCYFEIIERGMESEAQFLVVSGGNIDIDFKVSSPFDTTIFEFFKKQFGSHKWVANATGAYKVGIFFLSLILIAIELS